MRPASLQIDLAVIRGNVRAVQSVIGRQVRIAAVVKANAYGHGAVPVARAALEAGASMLCVAIVDEGIELRDAGIDAPILVLGPPDPGELDEYLHHDLIATLSAPAHATMLAGAARHRERVARVHVKLDTGMGRHGARAAVAEALARMLAGMDTIRVEGVFSHFGSATADDLTWTREQLRRFHELLGAFDTGDGLPDVHIANSAGTLRLSEAHLGMVRPGAILYGLNPGVDADVIPAGIRPALSSTSKICAVKLLGPGEPVGYGCTWRAPRESRIAIVPVGYADGYPRALSGRAEVLVSGMRCPVVGLISMDAITVDITDAPAGLGDEVVLIGRQDDERITVEELARRADSIVEEVSSRLSPRLPRIHLNATEANDD